MNKSNKNIDISTGSIGPIESTGPSDCPDSTGSTESSFALHVSVEPFHVLDNCGYGLIKITNVLSTPQTNWSLNIKTNNFTIRSFRGLSIYSLGNSITVNAPTWNMTLNSGETISSIFCYSGTCNFHVSELTSSIISIS